jgi:hypothetical protein
MQIAILLAVIVGVILWIIFDAPRRKHHNEHVAPLEAGLASLRLNIAKEEAGARQAREDQSLFTRDFGAELARARKDLDQAYAAVKPLKDERASLIEDHQHACRKLKSWYNHANGNFLGNGGKKLPKHALFSQSLGDRDDLKARRDRLSREIDEIKGAIDRIYRDSIQPAKAAIARIKEAQSRLHEFRRAGSVQSDFRKIADRYQETIDRFRMEERRLEAAITVAKEDFKLARKKSV